jgi:hypothetical protein
MRITSLAALLIVSGGVFAAELDLKGLKVGMTKDEVVAAHPGLECVTGACYYYQSSRKSTPTLQTLAGVPVKSLVHQLRQRREAHPSRR